MINRREVLRAGTAGALGAGMVGLLSPPAAAATADEVGERVSRRDWERLAQALSPCATLYRPVDPGYPPLALPYNHRYAGIHPAGSWRAAAPATLRW